MIVFEFFVSFCLFWYSLYPTISECLAKVTQSWSNIKSGKMGLVFLGARFKISSRYIHIILVHMLTVCKWINNLYRYLSILSFTLFIYFNVEQKHYFCIEINFQKISKSYSKHSNITYLCDAFKTVFLLTQCVSFLFFQLTINLCFRLTLIFFINYFLFCLDVLADYTAHLFYYLLTRVNFYLTLLVLEY